jgi:response regulator of citrate/malate metabolism
MSGAEQSPIRILVVEDDELLAEAHRVYAERVGGLEVVAVAHTRRAAMAVLRDSPVDLMLLDFNLPDGHGLDLCRALRAAGSRTDVIAVTSARDLAMVRAAVSFGVTQYLLKPFTYATFRDKLERYAQYRRQVLGAGEVTAQHEVDRMFAALRGTAAPGGTLPKGLGEETLDVIVAALRTAGALSAAEVAARTGISRVTARRYLEHLVEVGQVGRSARYGGPGRPEVEYQIK